MGNEKVSVGLTEVIKLILLIVELELIHNSGIKVNFIAFEMANVCYLDSY